MARRMKWGSLSRSSGGDIIRTDVRVNPVAVAALEGSMAEGLYATAKAGKQSALDHASGMFKSTHGFERTAFAIGFDNGRELGHEGPRRNWGNRSLRAAATLPVDPGLVAYFGYHWFVARFWETGTTRFGPRPSVSAAQSDMLGAMGPQLRTAAKKRGF